MFSKRTQRNPYPAIGDTFASSSISPAASRARRRGLRLVGGATAVVIVASGCSDAGFDDMYLPENRLGNKFAIHFGDDGKIDAYYTPETGKPQRAELYDASTGLALSTTPASSAPNLENRDLFAYNRRGGCTEAFRLSFIPNGNNKADAEPHERGHWLAEVSPLRDAPLFKDWELATPANDEIRHLCEVQWKVEAAQAAHPAAKGSATPQSTDSLLRSLTDE